LKDFFCVFKNPSGFPEGKMGITPVNPEQACPLQERLFSTEPTLIISLIAATRTITFILSE